MKKNIIALFVLLGITMIVFSAGATKRGEKPAGGEMKQIQITIGEKKLIVSLLKNATAEAFYKKLPLTLRMNELNGNEKYADLSETLPANAASVGTIQIGDLMLFGNRTVVLFYKSFSSSYSYSHLGRVVNPDDLSDLLGKNAVTIKFEQIKNNMEEP